MALSGCGADNDVMVAIGMPPSESAVAGSGTPMFGQSSAPATTKVPNLVVTPAQQAYLDALTAAGVHPSGELAALSIGSHVCQARAANKSAQQVWDFVLPMVRGDVRDSRAQSVVPPTGQINSVTADYIHIATDKLC